MWSEFTGTVLLCLSILIAISWQRTRQRLLKSQRDVIELGKSSQVLEQERQILERIARGASLKEVLDALTHLIESMAPGCLCTILLLDEERQHLLAGSGGSLPDEYMQGVNGIPIGPEVGACGSAAFRNETVVVEDIATDSRFAEARDFILSFGLRACWSVPIRDSKNSVLGTFAMYHRQPAKPHDHELRLVQAGAHLAGNAIERVRTEQTLRETAKRLELAERAAHFGIWEWNAVTDSMTLSKGVAELLGISEPPFRIKTNAWMELVHPDDRAPVEEAAARARRSGGDFQTDHRLRLPGGAVRWIRGQGHIEFNGECPLRQPAH